MDTPSTSSEGFLGPPSNSYVTPLLTDTYELTMVYAYWHNKRHEEPAVFDLFFRKNPFDGEFTIFAGLEEVIRHISHFHFGDDEIEYLKANVGREWSPEFFEWLQHVDCSKVKVYAIAEGTVVFPKIPLMRVEGPLAVVQMLETTLLTLVNYPSLICTNAARHRLVVGKDKQLVEFGLRRAQGPDGGISAARYAYMGGFDSTSNTAAAKAFGIPTRGTQAHSYVSSFIKKENLHITNITEKSTGKEINFYELVQKCREELNYMNTNGGELLSFTSYAIAFPNQFLALVDTYDTLKSGVPNFLIVALALHKIGYTPVGIRLDSGDLAYLSKQSRKMFQHVATAFNIPYFEKLNIMASSEINEDVIISLKEQGHEIDSFGVGTHLVTCQKQPALGCVYKLVEILGTPRIKVSQNIGKVTLPGKKICYRLFGSKGYAVLDLMVKEDGMVPRVGQKILCLHPFDESKKAWIAPTRVDPLHSLVWDCGKITAPLPSLKELKKFVETQIASFREDHLRHLNPTPYKVSLSQDLFDQLHKLWAEEVPVPDITNL